MIFLNTALAASPRYRQTEEPPVSTYDIDFQAKIDYANTIGETVPPEEELSVLNQRVLDFKATDAWVKSDAVLDYSGVDDTHIGFRLIDIKRRVKVDAYGGLIWTSEGVEGNGTSGYIDLKFNPSVDGVNYTLTNAGIVAKIYKNVAGTNTVPKCLIGIYSGSNTDYTMFAPRQTGGGGGTYYISHGGLWADAINTIGQVGLNGLYRSGNIIKVMGNGEKTALYAPNALPNLSFYMLARNSSGTANLFSNERVGFLAIGADMSAEHSAIENAI